MRALRFLRSVLSELVSLIVDDVPTFLGSVMGLAGCWLLARQLHVGRPVDGYLLFAVVWSALVVSMWREVRVRRAAMLNVPAQTQLIDGALPADSTQPPAYPIPS